MTTLNKTGNTTLSLGPSFRHGGLPRPSLATGRPGEGRPVETQGVVSGAEVRVGRTTGHDDSSRAKAPKVRVRIGVAADICAEGGPSLSAGSDQEETDQQQAKRTHRLFILFLSLSVV